MNQTMRLQASVVRYESGAVLERHAHGVSSVSVVIAGSIEEKVGQRAEVGRVGSVVVKPAGVEHCNHVGRNGAILLTVNGKEVDDVATAGWRWTEARGSAAAGLQLARILNRNGAVDTEQLLDLLGFAGQPLEARRNARWLDELRGLLDRDPLAPSVAELAGVANVHPVYLARVFRKQFGLSIRDYRRRSRVRRAANLLARSTLPIASIATELDFFDQSHLCRDFKAELNVSPSDYRAITRA